MKDKESHLKGSSNKADNIFVLINLASKRVRELVSGAPKLIQTEFNDPIKIALEEIAQGKITFGKKKDVSEEEKKEIPEEKQKSPKKE